MSVDIYFLNTDYSIKDKFFFGGVKWFIQIIWEYRNFDADDYNDEYLFQEEAFQILMKMESEKRQEKKDEMLFGLALEAMREIVDCGAVVRFD